MKDFFTQLFEYNEHCNRKLIAQMVSHEDLLSDRSKKLMSHCLNAHAIWNARISSYVAPFGVWDVHEPSSWKEMDDENHSNTDRILSERELFEVIGYRNSKGEEFESQIKDMFFQVINHFTYHRAQIVSDLKAAGVEPVVTDYIYYVREDD